MQGFKSKMAGTVNTTIIAHYEVLRMTLAGTLSDCIGSKESLKLNDVAGLSTFYFHRLLEATIQVTLWRLHTRCSHLSTTTLLGEEARRHRLRCRLRINGALAQHPKH